MSQPLAAAAAEFHFAPRVLDAAQRACDDCEQPWRARDENALRVTAKVVGAFARAQVNESHLSGSTGYGYHDAGRAKYEALVADLMGTPRAIARLQLVSGTQAIVATLSALLGDGDTLCALTGRPYDTLRLALADHPAGLARNGVRYVEAAWPEKRCSSAPAVRAALQARPAVAFIQRSRGYAPRPSLTIAQLAELIEAVRTHAPGALVVVDNCYGEFVELDEPGDVGADAVVGSLIKNPGGGIALTGAYIAGTNDVIERVAERIFAPGLSTAVGPTLDSLRSCLAGLHRAPKAVSESLKIMDFAAALFARLGYAVDPACGAQRGDIIQAIRLGSEAKLAAFAAGLQRLLAINAAATPEPGPVPGYAEPVIMAGGAFVSGSTMELSCDAPLREPYEVYVQGGMDLAHGLLAVMSAASQVLSA